jgi:hypothetical protein
MTIRPTARRSPRVPPDPEPNGSAPPAAAGRTRREVTMASLTELPALRTWPKVLEAGCYNRVRLSLRRIANPLRVALPGHRGLEMILDDRVWLCVDALHDDQPILAWHAFEARNGLHEPVACRLHVYHMHGGLVMGTALEALDAVLRVRLAPPSSGLGGDDAAR